jgi:plasmid stabilization system protein ParE
LSYQIRYTDEAYDDLKRLYAFLLEQDIQAAEHGLQVIEKAIEVLKTFPFICRKAQTDTPFLRELVISFGVNGYVALFEIEENNIVTILAVRHQREDDYL